MVYDFSLANQPWIHTPGTLVNYNKIAVSFGIDIEGLRAKGVLYLTYQWYHNKVNHTK